jgi:hypothetical protein
MTPGPTLRFLFLTPFAFTKDNNNLYYSIYCILLYNEENRHLQILHIVPMRYVQVFEFVICILRVVLVNGEVASGIGVVETGPETNIYPCRRSPLVVTDSP